MAFDAGFQKMNMTKSPGPQTVLLIDDDEGILEVLGLILKRRCFDVLTARNQQEAMAVWKQNQSNISFIVSDRFLSLQEDSSRLLTSFKKDCPEIPIVVMSGFPPDDESNLLSFPAHRYLTKPFQPFELFDTLASLTAAG
jgi:two-component system cell cycle sensor histidine kinase/response regulator CckA